MEQRAWRTDPWFALEIVGDLVGDDQAEDSLGVRELCDRLTRVLKILALGKSDSHGLGQPALTRPASRTGILPLRGAENRSAPGVSSTNPNASDCANPLIASSVRYLRAVAGVTRICAATN